MSRFITVAISNQDVKLITDDPDLTTKTKNQLLMCHRAIEILVDDWKIEGIGVNCKTLVEIEFKASGFFMKAISKAARNDISQMADGVLLKQVELRRIKNFDLSWFTLCDFGDKIKDVPITPGDIENIYLVLEQ